MVDPPKLGPKRGHSEDAPPEKLGWGDDPGPFESISVRWESRQLVHGPNGTRALSHRSAWRRADPHLQAAWVRGWASI